jgi:DNA-binding transcriptional ArsR family regulator
MVETIRKTGRALADPNRVRILLALLDRDELCVCELTEMLGLAGATVSRHAAILLDAGLAETRKDGRWVHYRIARGSRRPLPDALLDWIKSEGAADPLARRDAKKLKNHILCKE